MTLLRVSVASIKYSLKVIDLPSARDVESDTKANYSVIYVDDICVKWSSEKKIQQTQDVHSTRDVDSVVW